MENCHAIHVTKFHTGGRRARDDLVHDALPPRELLLHDGQRLIVFIMVVCLILINMRACVRALRCVKLGLIRFGSCACGPYTPTHTPIYLRRHVVGGVARGVGGGDDGHQLPTRRRPRLPDGEAQPCNCLCMCGEELVISWVPTQPCTPQATPPKKAIQFKNNNKSARARALPRTRVEVLAKADGRGPAPAVPQHQEEAVQHQRRVRAGVHLLSG